MIRRPATDDADAAHTFTFHCDEHDCQQRQEDDHLQTQLFAGLHVRIGVQVRKAVASVAICSTVASVPAVWAADVALGGQVFKKCERCHTLDAGGAQAEGPNLHKIFGRKAGTNPGWQYSDAMKASNIVWNR